MSPVFVLRCCPSPKMRTPACRYGIASCPYARMFEPSTLGNGPSGLADWPRPFVFRAAHLDGCTVAPGAPFSFDLNLFDVKSPAIAYLVLAFSQLAQEGLTATVPLARHSVKVFVLYYDGAGRDLFGTFCLPATLFRAVLDVFVLLLLIADSMQGMVPGMLVRIG